MKKLLSLIFVLALVLLGYYFLKPCPRCEIEEILNNELYAISDTLGKYQFEVDGKVLRYWTVSDLLYFHINKEQEKNKFQDFTKSKKSPQRLIYIYEGDTLSVMEGGQDMAEIIFENTSGFNFDPCSINLPQFEECCTNQNSTTSNIVCKKPPTGDKASECEIIKSWPGKAFRGTVNDFPDLFSVKTQLKQFNKIISTGIPIDNMLSEFETVQIENGPASINVELTDNTTGKTMNLSVPFFANVD